ncbi:HD domain-containing protein [Burkholderia multivorans]|uniref:HD domain-containing protein n=1 Tax=Burkholderia multivorans TaxID=87883 RepID=UPI001C246B40|nr:HD domain-containing protein [Burkholderia multivorans]MBU9200304.1 HD domain-containing protein [Burkholderia multivorans]MDN8078570.1 HD domain-containing protein [Burkholderia multivorans]
MLSLESFQRAITCLGGGQAAGLHERLIAAWQQPQRHYHTLQHLEECLALAGQWSSDLLPVEQAKLIVALWFHDAVYDPQGSYNEILSAGMAREELGLLGMPPATVGAIAWLVEATDYSKAPGEPGNRLLDLLLDIDLAILGADPQRYREYAEQVGREYAFVGPQAYRDGRKKVLAHFVTLADAPAGLYRTPEGRALNAQAGANLRAELESL